MDEVYWSHTYADLRKIIDLTTQYEIATAYQTYESLNLVVAAMFGGNKKHTDGAVEITNFEQMQRAVEEMTGG